LRIIQSYENYDDYEYKVPIGINGDCYDRYLIRMEEMKQSLIIIDKALNMLTEGPIKVINNRVSIPPR
jgi:NADH:ubiquinone oxidoreductase subunit D